MRLENDNISPHWSAFEWDWLQLIIPGDTGAHLDAQFPVALQCINVPLSLPLPACLSFSLSPSFSLYRSLSLRLWAPLFEASLIVALWSEKVPLFSSTILKGAEIGVHQTTEPLLLASYAQHNITDSGGRLTLTPYVLAGPFFKGDDWFQELIM